MTTGGYPYFSQETAIFSKFWTAKFQIKLGIKYHKIMFSAIQPDEVMGSDFILPISGPGSCEMSRWKLSWPLWALWPSETCRRSGEICRNMGPESSNWRCAGTWERKTREKLGVSWLWGKKRQETMVLAVDEEKRQQKIDEGNWKIGVLIFPMAI